MKLFDVYPLYDIQIDHASDCYLWDKQGNRYLDFYGGHAVISVGHRHPHYLNRLISQLQKIGYYSNIVHIKQQQQYLELLSEISAYKDYRFFFCNSGAEAVENALKLASFYTGKDEVIAMKKSFHGRTSGAVSVTDNPNIRSPFNSHHKIHFVDLNDIDAVREIAKSGKIAAIIVEGIQGQAGVYTPDPVFMRALRALCTATNTMLIVDEIQSGYGRTGMFFAHQLSGIRADLITIAKGMGNGFPVAGVLIHPEIESRMGLLGTTFGGNPLAATAALAVLEIFQQENLPENARIQGSYLMEQLSKMDKVKAVRGRGLMIGVELEFEVKSFRKELIEQHHLFVGAAGNPHTIRLLPPLTVHRKHCDEFLNMFSDALNKHKKQVKTQTEVS
ncbi:MAG: aminotransferase class III-fold pyridoxal phosphate-dependent enzyme [Calditrichia bacterium]